MSDHDPICELAGGRCICAAVRDVQRHARTMERERIAQAIEAHGAHLRISDEPVILRSVAAQIARNGGRDE